MANNSLAKTIILISIVVLFIASFVSSSSIESKSSSSLSSTSHPIPVPKQYYAAGGVNRGQRGGIYDFECKSQQYIDAIYLIDLAQCAQIIWDQQPDPKPGQPMLELTAQRCCYYKDRQCQFIHHYKNNCRIFDENEWYYSLVKLYDELQEDCRLKANIELNDQFCNSINKVDSMPNIMCQGYLRCPIDNKFGNVTITTQYIPLEMGSSAIRVIVLTVGNSLSIAISLAFISLVVNTV
ncbi:uncharacterized protein LOC128954725 [Oppia nitens]|uniref:uncharacterized protein LOC128954725 n=1 Tax=Oppia nitens TaxID=1686743 RepID=UPI0023DCD0E9|nr:uncharacterized protein LOC128954725 [Oppia nitens]